MTTALLAVSILGNLIALVFAVNAHRAARAAAVDTMRLDGIIEHEFHIVPGGKGTWGVVHDAQCVASGSNLRAVIDEADNKVADHG